MKIITTLLLAGLLGSVSCSNQVARSAATPNVTNADLKQTVQSNLASDPELAQVEVDADASQNQVTLSGSAPTEQSRTHAIDLAKTIQPTPTVIDKITVTPAEATRSDFNGNMAKDAQDQAKALGNKIGNSLDDAWLYTKVEAKLVGHTAAPALKINVDVVNNVVTLRGEVQTVAAKQEAERIARETEGVREVRNLLQVKA